ncbi:unnamed protein product, partial [Meganyctiphanes norvegica]
MSPNNEKTKQKFNNLSGQNFGDCGGIDDANINDAKEEDTELCEGKIIISENFHELEHEHVFGEFIPTFYSFDYGISGTFYTVKDDPQKIYIKDFSYNGKAPRIYLYIGLTHNSGVNNFYIPSDYRHYDPCNTTEGFIIGGVKSSVEKWENQDMLLVLPRNYTIYNIRWIMVWCHAFGLDMGHVWNKQHFKEESIRYKRENSAVDAADTKNSEISDGESDDDGLSAISMFFIFPGGESSNIESPPAAGQRDHHIDQVGAKGYKIPDETGSKEVLRAYENENITLSLPGNKTIYDMKWLSVFCDSFLEDFGHVRLDGNMTGMFEQNESYLKQNESYLGQLEEGTSDQQIEMSEDQENMNETKVLSEDEPETKPKSEPVPEPEPGVDHPSYNDEELPSPDETKDTKGLGSITSTSYQLMIVTIGLYILLR